MGVSSRSDLDNLEPTNAFFSFRFTFTYLRSCEQLGGPLDVTEETNAERSLTKMQNEYFQKTMEEHKITSKELEDVIDKMDAYCATKKNMFLPVHEGIRDANCSR